MVPGAMSALLDITVFYMILTDKSLLDYIVELFLTLIQINFTNIFFSAFKLEEFVVTYM